MPFDAAHPQDLLGYSGGRERSPAKFLPFFDHIAPDIMVLKDGGVMAMLRLPGVPWHLSSNASRNGAGGRHFALLQLLADRQTEIVEHYASHRHVPAFLGGQNGSEYERGFSARYDRAVLGGLRTREWFVTIIVRSPKMGQGWFKAVQRRFKGLDPTPDPWALRMLGAKVRTAQAALSRFGAVRLGTRTENGTLFSEIGEALVFLRTLRCVRVPLARPAGALGESLYRDRVRFGTNGFMIERDGGLTRATYGRMFGLHTYPKRTRVGMFDGLLTVDADMVVANGARPLSRAQATDRIELTLSRMRSAEARAVTDTDELEGALEELARGQEVRASHAWTLAVHASSPLELDEAASQVADLVAGAGCVPAPEGIAAGEAAYWTQLPGNHWWRPRPAVLGLRRFSRFSSLDGYPTGNVRSHRWGAPLRRYPTSGGTAYDHGLHDGQNAMVLYCGPIGSGKTAEMGADFTFATRLLGANDRGIFLDKDHSNKLTIVNNGGGYVDLKRGEPSGMAPLRRFQNTPADREAAADLIVGMIRADGGPAPGPGILARVAKGVAWTLRLPPEQRGVGVIHAFLPPSDPTNCADRLRPWCWGESRGWAFDGPADLIDFAGTRIMGVDVTSLLNDEVVLPIAAAYLLNAAEKIMDGRRVIFVVEEGRFLLPKPYFAKRFEDVILTGRKKNISFWFACQQPEHLLGHEMGSALLAQMRTRKLFKNELADRGAYCGDGRWGDGLHCTPQEYMQIREGMTAGTWSVLIQRPGSSIICRNDLSGMPEDIPILSGTPRSVRLWDRIADELGTADPAVIRPVFLSRLEEASA